MNSENQNKTPQQHPTSTKDSIILRVQSDAPKFRKSEIEELNTHKKDGLRQHRKFRFYTEIPKSRK